MYDDTACCAVKEVYKWQIALHAIDEACNSWSYFSNSMLNTLLVGTTFDHDR